MACFYVTLSLLTSLHQDGAQAEVRRGNRAAVDYRQCSIFMVSTWGPALTRIFVVIADSLCQVHMGGPENINHLQACAVESAAHHHPGNTVCLAIYVGRPGYLSVS